MEELGQVKAKDVNWVWSTCVCRFTGSRIAQKFMTIEALII